jgi:hypothetical protein
MERGSGFGNSEKNVEQTSITIEQYKSYNKEIKERGADATDKIVTRIREAIVRQSKPENVPQAVFDSMLKNKSTILKSLSADKGDDVDWDIQEDFNGSGAMAIGNNIFLRGLKVDMIIDSEDLKNFKRYEAWARVYIYSLETDLAEVAPRLVAVLEEFPL